MRSTVGPLTPGRLAEPRDRVEPRHRIVGQQAVRRLPLVLRQAAEVAAEPLGDGGGAARAGACPFPSS